MGRPKRLSAELQLPAIEIRQGPRRVIYLFAVDGKQLPRFTSISRIGRNDEHAIRGYQRPEVLSHISQIREYLESADPMLPNAIVVAFSPAVRFEPEADEGRPGFSRSGTLIVPLPADGAPRPGWIVDGQQRAAAIRDADIPSFPVSVVGFVAATEAEQREQFILVNSTKPLPKGLIYELLPQTTAHLPELLERRRFPSHLLELLNQDPASPLHGMIATPTTLGGTIKDNSVLKMLENSLSDGALYRFRDPSADGGNVPAMIALLTAYWSAVRATFPQAWGLPPRRSRLMHGAGIVSLGFLMDAIADRHRQHGVPDQARFAADLEPLKSECRWTEGYWDFGPGSQVKWNEVQNTSKDIQLLSNYLLMKYKTLVWNRPSAGPIHARRRRGDG